MRIPAALACATAVTAVLAAPADAKSYCRLAAEQPGDRDHHWYGRGTSEFGPWDLKSLDVATSATHLTGVVRLGDLTKDYALSEQDGGYYTLHFSLDAERHYFFTAELSDRVQRFVLFQDDDGWLHPEDEDQAQGVQVDSGKPVEIARPRGVVDAKAGEIRMTVPLTVFGRGVMTRGKWLYGFGGNSARSQVQLDEEAPPYWSSALGHHEDAVSARKGTTYPLGARSCVRVGR